MQILLTAISLVALVGCVLAYTRAEREADGCKDHAERAGRIRAELLEDRSRLTGVERDVAALRRELRKLAGKYYADRRDVDEDADGNLDEAPRYYERTGIPGNVMPVCENWTNAKQLGPHSDAAKCECLYCLSQRASRAQLRAALVPKTVAAQGELAKLNAAKP